MKSCKFQIRAGYDVTFTPGIYEVMVGPLDVVANPPATVEALVRLRKLGFHLEQGRLVELVAFGGAPNTSLSREGFVHLPHGEVKGLKDCPGAPVTGWVQLATVIPLVERRELNDQSQQNKDRWLLTAVRNRDTGIVRHLIESGANADAQANGDTALHLAVKTNDVHFFDELMDQTPFGERVNVNAKNSLGSTPVHEAARHTSMRVCLLLVGMGADMNAQDREGNTPLHIAAMCGGTSDSDPGKCCQQLVNYSADLEARSVDQRTPLHLAAQRNDPLVCQKLVEMGANLCAKDKQGRTPADLAMGDEARAAVTPKGFLSNFANLF